MISDPISLNYKLIRAVNYRKNSVTVLISRVIHPGTYSYFTSQIKFNTSNQSAYEHLFRSFITIGLVSAGRLVITYGELKGRTKKKYEVLFPDFPVLWTYFNNLYSLTLRRLMSYIYGAPILDVSRSHTTTQHSR